MGAAERYNGRREQLSTPAEFHADRLRQYPTGFHGSAIIRLPDGTMMPVDPPIKELIEDIYRLDFVEGTKDSCAGGKKKFVYSIKGVYFWGSYLFLTFKDDPQSAVKAAEFDNELKSLRVEAGEITGFIKPDLMKAAPQEPGHENRKEYYIVFDKPPTVQALDMMWQAVHGLVKKHLGGTAYKSPKPTT
jgi:hypothetical protein